MQQQQQQQPSEHVGRQQGVETAGRKLVGGCIVVARTCLFLAGQWSAQPQPCGPIGPDEELRRLAVMERGIVSGMLSNAHAELGCRVGCVAW